MLLPAEVTGFQEKVRTASAQSAIPPETDEIPVKPVLLICSGAASRSKDHIF
jgi:hypothetical protein